MFNKKLERDKRVLENLIEQRKDNLVKMRFDYYFASKIYPAGMKKLNDAIGKIDKEITRYHAELDVQRAQLRKNRNTEKIVEFEDKVRGLEVQKRQLQAKGEEIDSDIKLSKTNIEIEENMIKELTECYNNPNTIYEKPKARTNNK